MKIVVELDGISRIRTGQREVTVDVEHGATARDVLLALAREFPVLTQSTIDPAKGELYDKESWLAYEDRRGIPDVSEPLQLEEGSRLLILAGVC